MKWAFSLLFIIIFVSIVHRASGSTNIVKTIKVNHYGKGDFKSIQKAIDSVPAKNDQWIRIHVSKGVYREKVNIIEDKGFILLTGDGYKNTRIEWGDYAGDQRKHTTVTSATFTLSADNFVAKNITFKNTNTKGGQSVAAYVGGTKSAFYGCGFISHQDTLFDRKGLHYFKECYIEGTTDFIFGKGQSIYEGCTLYAVHAGSVTAQKRESPYEQNGFVFKYCNVSGAQKTILGRSWGPYARVIFYKTFMSNIVNPEGWTAWSYSGHENDMTYVEFDCIGPGSDTSHRVKWMKKLGPAELKKFTDITYIDSEGWIQAQP